MPHEGGETRNTTTNWSELSNGVKTWIAQTSGPLKAFLLPTGLLDLKELTAAPANPPSGWGRFSLLNGAIRFLDSSGTNLLAAAGSFLGLSDTPGSFTGHGSKLVAVNSGATALEFIAATEGVEVLLADATTVSSVGGAKQTLKTYTVVADTFAVGDLVRITLWGEFDASAEEANIFVYWGGTGGDQIAAFLEDGGPDGGWQIEILIAVTGTSAQEITSTGFDGSGLSGGGRGAKHTSSTKAIGSNQDIVVQSDNIGGTSDNAVRVNGFIIEKLVAAPAATTSGLQPFRAHPSAADWIDGTSPDEGQQTARTMGPFGIIRASGWNNVAAGGPGDADNETLGGSNGYTGYFVYSINDDNGTGANLNRLHLIMEFPSNFTGWGANGIRWFTKLISVTGPSAEDEEPTIEVFDPSSGASFGTAITAKRTVADGDAPESVYGITQITKSQLDAQASAWDSAKGSGVLKIELSIPATGIGPSESWLWHLGCLEVDWL